jgi:2-oxoisovalerate dehydrogenase E2 component (dihydrolipoyl transacylase)
VQPKVEAVVESKPVAAATPRPAVCQGPLVAREAE